MAVPSSPVRRVSISDHVAGIAVALATRTFELVGDDWDPVGDVEVALNAAYETADATADEANAAIVRRKTWRRLLDRGVVTEEDFDDVHGERFSVAIENVLASVRACLVTPGTSAAPGGAAVVDTTLHAMYAEWLEDVIVNHPDAIDDIESIELDDRPREEIEWRGESGSARFYPSDALRSLRTLAAADTSLSDESLKVVSHFIDTFGQRIDAALSVVHVAT